MKHGLTILVMVCCGSAQQDAKVTYLATQASVQDVVRAMAAQAGLGYDFQKSFEQTDPLCRRWVHDGRFEAIPFGTAMRRVLEPVGLTYDVKARVVVLYRLSNAPPSEEAPPSVAPLQLDRLIDYSADRKSVQDIAIDLARQVGLQYNWNKSAAQTDPERRRFLDHVRIRSQSFDQAMAGILGPVGLRYRIEENQVVLYRK